MQQQDIKDIIKLLADSISDKDFMIVEDVIDQLKEYLDDEIGLEDCM